MLDFRYAIYNITRNIREHDGSETDPAIIMAPYSLHNRRLSVEWARSATTSAKRENTRGEKTSCRASRSPRPTLKSLLCRLGPIRPWWDKKSRKAFHNFVLVWLKRYDREKTECPIFYSITRSIRKHDGSEADPAIIMAPYAPEDIESLARLLIDFKLIDLYERRLNARIPLCYMITSCRDIREHDAQDEITRFLGTGWSGLSIRAFPVKY